MTEESQLQQVMKGGKMHVINDSVQRSDFKAIITPHLEQLLQYSLWLTKNGLVATRLMREALREACQLFHESLPKLSWDLRLHEILTRKFLSGHHFSDPWARSIVDHAEASLITGPSFYPEGQYAGQQQLQPSLRSDADSSYLNAIANMPDVCRSAALLTYLEGIHAKVNAGPDGDPSQEFDSVLSPGRQFIREQLYHHLIDEDSIEMSTKREDETA